MNTKMSFNDIINLGSYIYYKGVCFVYFGGDLNLTTTDTL